MLPQGSPGIPPPWIPTQGLWGRPGCPLLWTWGCGGMYFISWNRGPITIRGRGEAGNVTKHYFERWTMGTRGFHMDQMTPRWSLPSLCEFAKFLIKPEVWASFTSNNIGEGWSASLYHCCLLSHQCGIFRYLSHQNSKLSHKNVIAEVNPKERTHLQIILTHGHTFRSRLNIFYGLEIIF